MRKLLITALVSAVFFCSAGTALAAQAIMFQPVVSIYTDGDGLGLLSPEDVAVTAATIVVADTGNDRLVRYVLEGNEVKFVSQIKVSQLPSPIRVQLNSKGEILALSGKNRRIVRLGADGQFLANLEMKNVPQGEAVVLRSFKLDKNDNVYLLDIYGGRLIVASPQGEFIRQVAFPKEFGSFSDLAVDSGGTVYLVDSAGSQIHSASKDAKSFSPLTKSMKEQMEFPTYIATDNLGTLYVTDQNGGKIILLGQDGSFRGQKAARGWNEGQLNYPVGICLNGSGYAFVADRDNNRVQIFR